MYFAFSPTMIAAVSQASPCTQSGVANAPMFFRFDVKWISGITAKASWRLSTTWLRTSRCCIWSSPTSVIVSTAGTRAIVRVTSRRSQGAIRRSR